MVELIKFCNCGGSNKDLSSPFSDDQYSYATNGQMIIRVPKIQAVTKAVPEGLMEGDILNKIGIEAKGNFPKYPPPDFEKCGHCKGSGFSQECEECDGEGYVDLKNDHNQYEFDCKTCDGNAFVPGGNRRCCYCDGHGQIHIDRYSVVDFGELDIAIRLLEKIKDLPGIKIGKLTDNMLPFSFDGGDGLLMATQK